MYSLPNTTQELLQAFDDAIRWEFPLWIVANRDALQAFALGVWEQKEDASLVLCLTFWPIGRPLEDDISPFRIGAADIISRMAVGRRVRACNMIILKDPSPGAYMIPRAAQAKGHSLGLIHCYCNPVAYEICVPVELDGRGIPRKSLDPHFSREDLIKRLSLKYPALLDPRRKVAYITPDKMRHDQPTLDVSAPRKHLEDWTTFYGSAIQAACYKALGLDADLHAGRDRVYAIHTERSNDSRAAQSVAFLFKVVNCEVIQSADVNQWLTQVGESVGVDMSFMQNVPSPETNRAPSGATGLAASLTFYTPPRDAGPSDKPSFHRTRGTVPGLPRKWCLDIIDPKAWLTAQVESGLYLCTSLRQEEEDVTYSAWGFATKSLPKTV